MLKFKVLIAIILFFCALGAQADSQPLEQRLTAHLKHAEEEYGLFSQSVAILKDGRLIYTYASGKSNVEFDIPATPETVYSIFSVTKLFVTTRLLHHVEKGVAKLDDGIGKYLEGLPPHWQLITIRQLLSHISGLPEYSLEYMTHLTGDEAISAVFDKELEFETGSKSSYNQTNFYLIQRLLEQLEKKPLEQLMQTSTFDPLALGHTSFGGEFNIIKGRASRYEGTKRGSKRVMRNDPPDYYFAANGMNSNVRDMAKWFEALLAGELISKETLYAIWQPVMLDNGKAASHANGWAYGARNGYRIVGHYGANIVNVRHFFKPETPEQSVTVIHLTNGRTKPFSLYRFSRELAGEILPNLNE